MATKEEREALLERIAEDAPELLAEADDSLKADREFVMEAVRLNGDVLQYVAESLKADREVVLAAYPVTWALEYADDSLKADREFMMEAMRLEGEAFEHASDSLKADREFVLAAVTQFNSPWALGYADDRLKADREIVMEAVKEDGYLLEHADDSLKADREVVLEAVKQHGEALEFADDILKADREVVLEAMKQHVYSPFYDDDSMLKYADDSLKCDREFVREAVKLDGNAIKHASEELQQDEGLQTIDAVVPVVPRTDKEKANILLHELRAYLEPEAFDQFLDAEEGSDSYRINCVYEKGDGNSEYAEWCDHREIVFFPTWRLTYDLFWAGDPHGHSTFKGTECEVLLAWEEEALDEFVNWVKERVDWEELEENWNNVMADESLKANIVVEPLFQVEA